MQAKINTHFSHLIFATLKKLGIDQIFMAPGSRSSPLSLAADHYAASFITHFDERALAFMALGAAKASQRPAVVITTSGTAVGNLLPAVMEAHALQLPLLLITADRPQELHHRGSNQTLQQTGLFTNYTVFATYLDAPVASFNDKALCSLLSHCALQLKKGPVHLNIPLHEPLFDQSCHFPHDVEFRQDHTDLSSLQIQGKKGLIILAEDSSKERHRAQFFHTLSEHLDAPLIADITSGYRSYGLPSLHYYPLILENLELEVDYILHFGHKITSKSLENYLKKFGGVYNHFETDDNFYDPYHKINATYRVPYETLLSLPKAATCDRCQSLYSLNELLKHELQKITEAYPHYVEAMYIEPLSELETSSQIFCGNSLPIRHMDAFFFPTKTAPKVITQRGVSGIDGLIATACGLSLEGIKTYALLGDLSSLYDINALALISTHKLPLIPLVFNNYGGGIFSYLPIAQLSSGFDKIMATSHNFNFKELARGFDLDYICLSSSLELKELLEDMEPGTFVEIISEKSANPLFFEHIKNELKTVLQHALL